VFDVNGDPVQVGNARGPIYRNKGMLTTSELDSGIYRCVWHRVVLVGEIPPGTTIEVASFSSEIVLSSAEISDIFDNKRLTRSVIVRFASGPLSDALIQSDPGRYLWLRLAFSGDGQTSPAIEYAEIEFPRISLRRYLPAAFGEEPVSADFTDRFLALFDTTHRSVESKIDNFARYFDPASTPADRRGAKIDFLSWLASWVGITFDRQWPEERRRRFLKQAGKLFPLRGTRPGLWSQLLIYLGMEQNRVCCERSKPRVRCVAAPYNCEPVVTEPCSWQPPPLILEHFKLRRWLFVGLGKLHDQAVLWGRRIVNRSQVGDQHAQVGETQLIKRQDPLRDPFHYYAHQFSVFVPARFGKDDRERKGLENLLKAESPAHTKWTIHYVEPRFRIGFQSMIGLDAVVGRYPIGVRMEEARLGQGTVLSSPPRDAGKPAFRVGDAPRIGNSTTLN
jgi:phage tail-like protein